MVVAECRNVTVAICCIYCNLLKSQRTFIKISERCCNVSHCEGIIQLQRCFAFNCWAQEKSLCRLHVWRD